MVFDLEMQSFHGSNQRTPVLLGLSSRTSNISNSKLSQLSGVLAYIGPTSATKICHDLDPYFEYLERARERWWYTNQLGDVDAFIDLFLKVAQHLATETSDSSILTFSDSLLHETNENLGENARFSSKEFLEIVLHQIGLWLLMEDSFTIDGYRSQWMAAYCQKFPAAKDDVLNGDIGLRELVKNGGLLPAPIPVSENNRQQGITAPTSIIGNNQLQGIPREELNAYTLTKLGRVSLRWSMDITEHLKLNHEHDKTSLSIFALPCVLARHSMLALSTVGISQQLQYEIILSYGMLFGRLPKEHSNRWFPGTWMCRCLGCKLAQKFEKEMNLIEEAGEIFDPLLRELCRERRPTSDAWVMTNFKHLWPRLQELNRFLNERKPRSLRQLFRDKRDTLQYYTFCFAAIVLILTVLQFLLAIVQTTTGVLQVVGVPH